MSIIDLAHKGISYFFWYIIGTIFLLIDSVIYYFINLAYRIFVALAQIKLFSNADLRDFAARMYIVVGVVALFLVAYALILAIINPDNATKGQNSLGKVIPNIAMAIFGIAITPVLFDYAFQAQHLILCNNVIPKLFLASDSGADASATENMGAEMAELIFETFFYPKMDSSDKDEFGATKDVATIEQWNDRANEIKSYTGKVSLAEAYVKARDGQPFFWVFEGFLCRVADGDMGYTIIVASLAGGFAAYVFISLSIDMAIRLFKLSYLELIAPLPILTIIIPGQNKVFKNWLSKTMSCFLEVFIKIATVSFAAYMIKHIPNLFWNNEFWAYACQGNSNNFFIRLYARLFMLIGICGFIKQGPKLLTDILGIDSKGFKLGIKDKLADAGVFQAAGAIGGATTGLIRGKNPLTAIKGGINGFKNNKDTKNFKDLAKNTGKGANDAITDKYKRISYARQNGWDGQSKMGYVKSLMKGKKDDFVDWAKDYPKDDVGKYKYHEDQQKKMKQVTDAESAIDSKAASLMDKYAGKVKAANGKTLQELRGQLEALKQMQVDVQRTAGESDDDYLKRKQAASEKHAETIAAKEQEVIDAEKYIKKQIRSGTYDNTALNEAERQEMLGLYKDFQTAFIENLGSFKGAPDEYRYERDKDGNIVRDAAGNPVEKIYHIMKDASGNAIDSTYEDLLKYVNQAANKGWSVEDFRKNNFIFDAAGNQIDISSIVDVANNVAKVGSQIDQQEMNKIAAAQRAKEEK